MWETKIALDINSLYFKSCIQEYLIILRKLLKIQKSFEIVIINNATNVNELFANELISISGDKQVIAKLKNSLVEFDSSFEVVPRPIIGQEVDSHLYQ